MALPNIPPEFATLQDYIEYLSGQQISASSATLTESLAAISATVSGIQSSVTSIVDISTFNANVSANPNVMLAMAHIANMNNPHATTAAQVGLGNVPNIDWTAQMNANNAKVGITPAQANAIIVNTAKVGITPQQTSDILAADAHAVNYNNPHQTTSAQVGLGNVPNIDCTNASNITTGTLPNSVIPPIAIVDAFSAASQAAQLALTIHKGDVCVRTDLSQTFINQTGNNVSMADWLMLLTPINNVLSVNGFTGTVVLTTTNIAEGTNFYYTDARVTVNPSVANSAALAHSHGNKAILDATTASFTTQISAQINIDTAHTTNYSNPHETTAAQVGLGNVPNIDWTATIAANTAKVGITTQQAADILAADAHVANMNNPHQTTAAQVGLGNVTNVDFTAQVNAADAHIANMNNPHETTATQVGLGNVPNVDWTAQMNANNAKVGITTDQAAAIVLNTAKVGITPQQTADILTADAHMVNFSNPHQVTATQVGLGNVQNIDTTNASNITTGTLPNNVIPPLAIVDTFVAASDAAMLALTIHKGDVCVRTDLHQTFINTTGNNTSDSDWQILMTPIDNVLSVNGFTGAVSLTTSSIAEGTNLYYTDARVSANVDVAANTADRHWHTNKAVLDGTDTSFTAAILNAINLNTAKVGITTDQAAAIVLNTAKVGITAQQAQDILNADAHEANFSNPHQVTQAQVGLSVVPNVDFTNSVNIALAHVADIIDNPHHVTATQVGLGNLTNVDFTSDVNAAMAHIANMNNPHATTAAQVGLGNVPNVDWTAQMNANNAKVGITTQQAADILAADAHEINYSNPHQVTATQVGLGNVKNVDTTNASNITTGVLPSNVIPAIAIVDVYVAGSDSEMFALTVHRGDVCVRTDLSESFINKLGANSSLSDWQELLTPIDNVLSVNGQTGVVVLSTSNIAEGSNLYYTDARVSNNTDVAQNTANRHWHTNKAILDATTASFTTQNLADILAADAHEIDYSNPHQVTAAQVGLGNVPNVDFTAVIALNTAKVGITPQQAADILAADAHEANMSNPHQVTKAQVGLGNLTNVDFTTEIEASEAHIANMNNPHATTAAQVGLGNVPNVDFTATIAANTAKVGITPDQAAAIVANTAKVGITPQQAADILAADAHEINYSNPHQVTKAQVGLGNVQNIDTTNASNITTGTLPTSVLPPLAIADVFAVSSQAAQLALTVHKGDICVRTDLNQTFINQSGNNASMADWLQLATPIDNVLSVNGYMGVVVLTTSDIAEGTNLYYTDVRVSNNPDVTLNTSNRHWHTNKAVLDGTDTSFTATILAAIDANTAKVGITPQQAAAIVANTAKVGITPQQAADILAADAHEANFSNPHQVTQAQVGLSVVPNVDFTNAVAANTAHRLDIIDNPHHVTKAQVGLGNVPNTDFTSDVAAADAHIADISDNPHHVTAAQVGLGNLQNVDLTAAVALNTAKVGITPQQTADILAADAHALNMNNPHETTAAQVGLGNVKNVDCTNASNITTGTLPTSVLPPLAIADVFVVASDAAMLALTVHKGDICVRTDLSVTYINFTGNNTSDSDWLLLSTPIDNVLSVNGFTGTVVLTTSSIAEGTNLYYTDARVSNNTDVAQNTANRHWHTNKVILDGTTASFTTQDYIDIQAADAHVADIYDNPHDVTKAQVGLGNVTNVDFTADINNSISHIANMNNPHATTAAQVGLGNVKNVDCTNASNITTGTLPTSVLPALAIMDVFTAASDAAMLALTVHKGDVCVRTDVQQTYINLTGNNTSDADWLQLADPVNNVLSVNGQMGTVVLSTSNIAEGTNLYYTDARVSANTDVAANTTNRHWHTNKAILDATNASFTTDLQNDILANNAKVGITVQQAADILAADAHEVNYTNPHQTTAFQVGLGNVPNTDFTSPVNAALAHIADVIDNPHHVTQAQVGLGNVPNIDWTSSIAASTAHIANTNNPHATTAAQVGLGNVVNVDWTAQMNANNAKVGITPQQTSDILAADAHMINLNNPHATTAAQVGLGNVPNTDFTADVTLLLTEAHTHSNKPLLDACTASFTTQDYNDIVAADAHMANMDNPHNVTVAQIGAETPAGAQTKATIALNSAEAYTNLFMTLSPAPALFDTAFRNSVALETGVGIATFTRASTATHFDRYGILRDDAINVPRFGKDGLLIEGQSTNYFVGSTDATTFTQTNCTVADNQTYDADFQCDVSTVSINLPGQAWNIARTLNTIELVKGQYYTFSARMSSASGISGAIHIQDSSGMNVGDFGGVKTITLTSSLSRFQFTVYVPNATIGYPIVSFVPSTLTAGASFNIVDMQFENLNFASSVMPTTTATGPVTRAADQMTIPYLENFPGSLSDKTVTMDVRIWGTVPGANAMAFASGDLQIAFGNGTAGDMSWQAYMSNGVNNTPWVASASNKVRVGVTYDSVLDLFTMYLGGQQVAQVTNVNTADAPLANIGSYNAFMASQYPNLNPSEYATAVLQIPLDVLETEISLSTGSPFMSISNIRIFDECFSQYQMMVL